MNLNEIRIANFLFYINKSFDNSINKFAKVYNINVNQYYAITRGERQFGDKIARNVEKLMGLNVGSLDKNPNIKNETIDANLIDFSELMKYQEILKEIRDLQNQIIINQSKIKKSLRNISD